MKRDDSTDVYQLAARGRARVRSITVAGALLLLVLALVGVTRSAARPKSHARAADLATPAHAAAAGAAPIGFNRENYGFRARLSLRTEARRYRVLVLQATDAPVVRRLHRFNRALKVFMYEETMSATPGGYQACTAVAWVRRHHPEWALRTRSGAAALVAGALHVDIANRAYQRTCLANAIATARRGGFDGIYLDDLGALPNYEYGSSAYRPALAKYATPRVWQAAVTSLLRYAGPAVHAHGLLLIGNIGGAYLPLWSRWTSLMDGSEEEAFTDIGQGPAPFLWWWPYQQANIAWSEAHGKLTLLHSHNTTEAGNVFGLASALMQARSHITYSTSNGNYYGYEQWYPEYTTARRLGAPLGGAFRHHGARERRFRHGLVLVNPSLHWVRGIHLGARYTGTHLTRVRVVSLPPTSGLILLRAG